MSIPKIIVKTKAKSTRGILEAIVNQHFVVGFVGKSYDSNVTAAMHYRDAVSCILERFTVTPRE